MSIWTRISDAISALAKGESLSDVFAQLTTPRERSAGFAIAVIALGAKMAKADGQVTRNEVSAFREVFTIPRDEEKAAARVFDLARTDVAGYDIYAQRIAAMFGPEDPALCDLMEGLFFIALADGEYHPNENLFLENVARIFKMPAHKFHALKMRFVPDDDACPYQVLGVTPDMSFDEIRKVWRQEVRDTHPDRMVARGVPEEAIKLAEKRLVAINRAWEDINAHARADS